MPGGMFSGVKNEFFKRWFRFGKMAFLMKINCYSFDFQSGII